MLKEEQERQFSIKLLKSLHTYSTTNLETIIFAMKNNHTTQIIYVVPFG